jgi:hypothetical protein
MLTHFFLYWLDLNILEKKSHVWNFLSLHAIEGIYSCDHKTFEYDFSSRTKQKTEHCIQYIKCFDWMILEYE